MIHKFQKYDSVLKRVNHGEGKTSWERAGTISGTLNKATDNDKPLYQVQSSNGELYTFHEDQLKNTTEGIIQRQTEFKPGVMV